jgi:NAD dependent epimerase/dehydratase family enzyme
VLAYVRCLRFTMKISSSQFVRGIFASLCKTEPLENFKMINVALAGGTGTVGKTIADVLAGQGKHHAIILTRKVSYNTLKMSWTTANILQESQTTELALPHFVVDYSDVDSLATFLEEHDIHTIICTFGINATSLAKSQFNLIKAAEASSATKRFIPSSFATAYPEE